ncbi:PH domain-containing protein [Paenibacillus donghaensis]|uniref:PH domain-containing protein n=1 Tax=Paenibacillus donghaensis TaxID=414771 RepID=UPI001883BBB0|nr:PH domain-containing protein [Paenibacillus donghaensis]MBE9915889.1 PH domain-containing protein [Paenibacillus donghaensis]
MKTSEPVEISSLNRLHPVSILYFAVKTLKELYAFLPLIPLIVIFSNELFGRPVNRLWLSVFLVTVAVLLIAILGWLRWWRFGYFAEKQVFYIEHGLLVKQKIWIHSNRIQSLDTIQSIYDRWFGLLRLNVETAGGKKPEAVLSSITSTEAARIRKELGFSTESTTDHRSIHDQAKESEAGVRILSVSGLLIHSLLPDKFMYVFVIFSVGAFKFGHEWLKASSIWGYLQDQLGSAWIVLLILILFTLSWIIAVTINLLGDYGFKLESDGDKLVIERGLLERKHITLPLDRIQAIHLVEHTLHKPLGYVSIRAVTAGIMGKDEKTITLFPVVRRGEEIDFLKRFVPAFSVPQEWSGVEPKTKRNFIVFPTLLLLITTIPAMIWLPWHLGWIVMFLSFIVFAYGSMEYKQMGWSIVDGYIAIRYGGFSRHRVIIPKRRVQWHQMSQTPFQEYRQLANLRIALASGKGAAKFTLRYASLQHVRQLVDSITNCRTSNMR